MAESFGRLLQRYRVAAGLSQEELGELAGVSTNAISALERSIRQAPHSATLDLLIEALKLDADSRVKIEEAAKLARARRIQAQRNELDPSLSDEVLRNNLPPELTSFVDREREVSEIKELLQSYRLVTVVGPGGAGKTRCAMKIGGDMLGGFVDGVWAADLTVIADPSFVSAVIARALKVQEAPNRPILESLLAYLKRRRLFLILDNCEHVIDEARHIAAAILRDCPEIRILATSRESLSIAGEQAYHMPSLPVPSASERLSASEMLQYGAVQLFSDRASSFGDGFTLTVESAPHVANICRRVDGIPLAIELAAARVRTLSPKQLAQRLDELFRMLTRGDRSALPRHRTMRALIDWSYDLLSDDERRLFGKLSIFSGDFTLELASAVCSDLAADDIGVLDLLDSLVDKSLVHAERQESVTYYRILETTRQYARERLTEAGEYAVTAHAHANAFLKLAEGTGHIWETTSERVASRQYEQYLDNFRSALKWSLEAKNDVLLGQRLVGALLRAWSQVAPAEGRRWVRLARDLVTAETPIPVIAALDLVEATVAAVFLQLDEGLTAAEAALTRYRELHEPLQVASAQHLIGQMLFYREQFEEAERMFTEALAAARALGARKLEAFALQNLGKVRARTGDLSAARSLFTAALSMYGTMGAERGIALVTESLSELEFRSGNVVEALRLSNEALAVHRALTEPVRVAVSLCNIAAYEIALERYDEARASGSAALDAARDAQSEILGAIAVQHLAVIAPLRRREHLEVDDDWFRSVRLLGYTDAHLRFPGESLREYTEQLEYDKALIALRDALGEEQVARLMSEGALWSEEQAVAEAMLI